MFHLTPNASGKGRPLVDVRLTNVLAVFEKSALTGRQWTENE